MGGRRKPPSPKRNHKQGGVQPPFSYLKGEKTASPSADRAFLRRAPPCCIIITTAGGTETKRSPRHPTCGAAPAREGSPKGSLGTTPCFCMSTRATSCRRQRDTADQRMTDTRCTGGPGRAYACKPKSRAHRRNGRKPGR